MSIKQIASSYIKQLPNILHKSHFSVVKPSPPDPILGLSVAFNKDTHPKKINLGVGAYRTGQGKPFVLSSVQKAKQIIESDKMDYEYLPIDGYQPFIASTQKLAFGSSLDAIKERLATVQTLSGTGSLRLGAEFIRHHYQDLDYPTVFIPNPTWPNHKNILKHCDINFREYAYYDKKNNCVDFDSMCRDIDMAPNRSIILLHACAHNPTGADPSNKQWAQLAQLCLNKDHIVWFDSAYQGFASGDVDRDSESYRIFIHAGVNIMLSQSFSKNMGLYGSRIGALSIMTRDSEEKENVLAKLKTIIRPIYSNPPVDGARIVSTIINDRQLCNEWYSEIHSMASRIGSMRQALRTKLEGTRDWSHITSQIGMFCYTGLTKEQVDKLINEYHIYLTSDGRISMAGINDTNIDYLAESILAVTK